MIELTQTRWQCLLGRLYWRDAVMVDAEMTETGLVPVYEMRPRRFAWLLRPLYRPQPLEG